MERSPSYEADWRAALRVVFRDWNSRTLITSPDVDGLLSAALVCHREGARLVGIYDTKTLFLFDGATRADALEALWLDHDISQPGIRCIGQHLCLHAPNDTLPRKHDITFNPNNYFRQSARESFLGENRKKKRDKYPFGTIHFLLEYFGEPVPGSAVPLVAHADGAWATAYEYRPNAEQWDSLMFGEGSFVREYLGGYVTGGDRLKSHQNLVSDLVENYGVPKRGSRSMNSRLPEEWRGVQGHQRIPISEEPGVLENFAKAYSGIAERLDWEVDVPRSIADSYVGQVVSTEWRSNIKRFDEFMVAQGIFSHAFTSAMSLRYTNAFPLPDDTNCYVCGR